MIDDLVGDGAGTAASDASLAIPVLATMPEARPSSGQTIFVVDDDRDIRTSVHALLTASGHHVEVFAAAESFLESCTGEARRGCLLLDIGLPGMSGLQMLERLKAEGVDLPVLFCDRAP